MIDVSIIVPIYNSEKYLKKCIDSLIDQTHNNIEILLINDGSTDNSEKIIKKYKDKRIKYISQKNIGIGKTRNKGIKLSKGKYIMFIDSDDYIGKNCVEKMYDLAVSNESDLVISNYYKVINGKCLKIDLPYFEPSSLKNNPNILNVVNLGPCNKLYKKELLNNIKFNEEYKYEDVPFVVNTLYYANKIVKTNEYLSYYVIHSNSETTIRDERIFDIISVCQLSYDVLKQDNNMKDNIINLFVMIITDYAAQCRYISDRNIRKRFINSSFSFLNKIDKKWYTCSYFMNLGIISKIIKSHKWLLNLYCDTIGIFYRL